MTEKEEHERRTQIMRERTRMRLPDDWHVPASLRPHHDLTAERKKLAYKDAYVFVFDHEKRLGAAKRARRK